MVEHFALPITDPTWIFFLVLSIIFLVPFFLEKLRVPAIVGLILAGLAIGPHGFNLLNRDSSFELFGKVGLYYIMFLASLEMNMQDLKKIKGKALFFGILSFAFPMCLGFFANISLLHQSLIASALIAATYSSHTLISYPLVMRFGLSRRKSVNITIGGTIIADTLTLIVLAVVGGMFKEHANALYWGLLGGKILLLGCVIFMAFPYVAKLFFRRCDDGVMQYIFVMTMVFLGAGLMEFVEMEGILGAFLTGIALNRQIPNGSSLMRHIEFIGNALFIPYFLIGVGMLINLRNMMQWGVWEAAGVMLAVCFLSKWLPAFIAQKSFKLPKEDRALIFGLSNARAAATLAIALVGYNILLPSGARLINDTILNGLMLLILLTCVVSTLITEKAARKLALKEKDLHLENEESNHILIAVNNPDTIQPLVQLALLLRREKTPHLLSAIHIETDGKKTEAVQSKKFLEKTVHLAASADVQIQTYYRFSVNTVSGLSQSVKELECSDLLIGLHHKIKLTEPFLGRLSQDLTHSVERQIMLYKHVSPLNTAKTIHVIAPDLAVYEPYYTHWAERVGQIASQISAKVKVYGHQHTYDALLHYWQKNQYNLESSFHKWENWNNLQPVAEKGTKGDLMIFVSSRNGFISRQSYLQRLPRQLEAHFADFNLLIVYPHQPQSSHKKLFNLSEG